MFVGSCMLVFGGFNGEYFNDLHYINVFEVKSKMEIPESCRESSLHKLVNNPQMSDHMLTTSDGERIPLHKGLIHNRF